MLRLLPWLFLLFPALELWVLILVGKEIGALSTVALVILSTLAGLFLLRLRGARIASRFQTELSAGRLPSAPIMDTLCMMAAGWLFLFPGFVSDGIAVLLLIPFVRQLLTLLIVARLQRGGFSRGTVHMQSMHTDEEGRVRWSSETRHTPGPEPGWRPEQADAGTDPTFSQGKAAVIIDCEPETTEDCQKKLPPPPNNQGPDHGG